MAADSAVTISGGGYLKTYNSADKLFQLVEGQPVAIMIYHNAEIMSVPWETVISLYREQAAGKTLETVEAYAEDFMNFLSGNPELFPAEHQDAEFFKLVAVVYSQIAQEFDYQVERFEQQKAGDLSVHVSHIFEFVVDQWHHDYQHNIDESPREELKCFPQGMGENIRRRYKKDIEDLIDSLADALTSEFRGLRISDETRAKLRDIAVYAVVKDAFFEFYTGLVFAGFGRADKYPSMRSYLVSNVVLGVLKRRNDRFADVTPDGPPIVQPFAQDRMIRTFVTGMDQHLRMFLFTETLKLTFSLLADVISRMPIEDEDKQKLFEEYSQTNLSQALISFFESVNTYQYRVHTLPIYRAIQNLPKAELADTAASLVKLNSFQQKVTQSIETVGGPIDVAVITRNGGLEWKKESAKL
ncbi:MAG: hypothetical protein Tsb0010_15800 [Parvularculaceae bacterium]